MKKGRTHTGYGPRSLTQSNSRLARPRTLHPVTLRLMSRAGLPKVDAYARPAVTALAFRHASPIPSGML
jgi:hypothetical protein